MTQLNRYPRSLPTGILAAAACMFLAGPAAATLTITGVTCLSATSSVDAGGNLTVTCNTAAAAQATVPGAPTIGTATAGNTTATVPFTAPASNGGAVIDTYRATCSPGGVTATGTGSSITVPNLTNSTPYTCTVAAHNSVGYGAESAASNSVTPTAAGVSPPPPAGCASSSAVVWTSFSNPGRSTTGALAGSTSVQNKTSYSFNMSSSIFGNGAQILLNVYGTQNNAREHFISDCPGDFTNPATATGVTNSATYCSAMGYTTGTILLAYPTQSSASKIRACILDSGKTYYLNIRTIWSASQQGYLGTGYLLDTDFRY